MGFLSGPGMMSLASFVMGVIAFRDRRRRMVSAVCALRVLDSDASPRVNRSGMAQSQTPTRMSVQVPIEGQTLSGDLCLSADPHGLIVFPHRSGSNRRSPRNQCYAGLSRPA